MSNYCEVGFRPGARETKVNKTAPAFKELTAQRGDRPQKTVITEYVVSVYNIEVNRLPRVHQTGQSAKALGR